MSLVRNPRKGMGVGLSPDVEAIMTMAADVQRMVAQGINPDGSLKPEAIRALLKLRGVNIRALAELHGYTDPQFHQVINRDYPDKAVQDLLADALGLPAVRVWGRRDGSAA